MLDYALALAREGLPVFPCNGKHPIPVPDPKTGQIPVKGSKQGGFKVATTDEAWIRAWWGQYPHANPAIAIPEGVVVVDVDPRNGGSLEAVPWALASGTRSSVSGRGDGGTHFWFRIDPGLSLPAKFADGIDLKMGGRSYVMGHGAIHPDTGKPYQWQVLGAIAEAPAELLAKAYPRGTLSPEQVAADLEDDERTIDDGAIDWLVQTITPAYTHGQMHNVACRSGAGSNRGAGNLPTSEHLPSACHQSTRRTRSTRPSRPSQSGTPSGGMS